MLFGLPIDPNSADPLTLETLPGIGPARAQAWVAARNQRAFESKDDLLRIHGIGPRTLGKLTPWLGAWPAPGVGRDTAGREAPGGAERRKPGKP